ncbi:dihydrofolate reductase [bacterium]|nr:dihydrofolate reductase [bacterium]
MKASIYIATSVDGFIARTDGSLDWMPQFGASGEDYGYHSFMESVDALVMGRKTYDKILSFGVNWPYTKPVVVLSSRPIDIPDELNGKVVPMGGSMPEVVQGMIQRGYEHVYVDGAATIQTFLNFGLVDQIIVTVIPVLIGTGIPLFGPVSEDIRLELVSQASWPSGLTQNTYRVVSSDS